MDNYSESDFNLSSSGCIYRNEGKVEIYLENLQNENLVVKKIYFKNSTEELNIIRGVDAMVSLDHANIVKVRNRLLGKTKDYMLIVMDYYPGGDLEKEIKSRANRNFFWGEDQLLNIFKQLVSGFIYMQTKEMAHMNINPQNILKNGESYFISDFKTVYKLRKNGKCSYLAGTPAYFSPKLSDAYKSHSKGEDISSFDHNAYKSDVFSLGLTFLYMANLKQFENQNNISRSNFEFGKKQLLETKNYSDRLKGILMKMLEYDENNRPDFIQLGSIFYENGFSVNCRTKIVFNTAPPASNQIIYPLKNDPVIDAITENNVKISNQHNNESYYQPLGNNADVFNNYREHPFGAGNNNNFSLANHSVNYQSRALITGKNVMFNPEARPSTNSIENIRLNTSYGKCWRCNQPLENFVDFTQIIHYKLHKKCLEEAYMVRRHDNYIYEMLVHKYGGCINVNTKTLQNCDCGYYTYLKPSFKWNACLTCIKNWPINIYEDSCHEIFYKILSQYCIEVNILNTQHTICKCLRSSVEIIVNRIHYLCYRCLDMYFSPNKKDLTNNFNGLFIFCPWKCCKMQYVNFNIY